MKRLVFALLYNRGQFVLSRNFRLQRVGDINWVLNNYRLLDVSCGVDEIVILDVGKEKDPREFAKAIKTISNSCFVPLSAGGGIVDTNIAELYMASGADKLILNSAFYQNPDLPLALARHYGRQCIIASIDFSRSAGQFELYSASEQAFGNRSVADHIILVQQAGAGEILCQSVEKDGTGMGLELEFADQFLNSIEIPCIMLGGVGQTQHFLDGLEHENVDAVCTANLLNFIGDALENSRAELINRQISLPAFSSARLEELRNHFSL